MQLENAPAPESDKRIFAHREIWITATLGLAFLWLAARFLAFVHLRAVNIFFGDQWGYLTPVFDHQSWWQMFRWQWGPHRQGLGLLLDWAVLSATRWDSRAESYLVAGILLAAAIAAVLLKRRLIGRLDWSDIAILFMFVNLMTYESLIGVPNPSHSALPALLAILLCMAWNLSRVTFRYAFVLTLNFLLIYTGFGLLIGPVTIAVFLGELALAIHNRERKNAITGATVATGIALLSFASFFAGYQWAYPSKHLNAAVGHETSRVAYAALILANFFRMKAQLRGAEPAALLLLALMVAVLMIRVLRWLRGPIVERNLHRAIVILLGFSLLFCFIAALGRAHFGIQSAQSSRYIPYVALGVLALYLHFRSSRKLAAEFAVWTLVVATFFGSQKLSFLDRGTIYWLSEAKKEWRACYLETASVAECDQRTSSIDFRLTPTPELLPPRLEMLRTKKLNLYK